MAKKKTKRTTSHAENNALQKRKTAARKGAAKRRGETLPDGWAGLRPGDKGKK